MTNVGIHINIPIGPRRQKRHTQRRTQRLRCIMSLWQPTIELNLKISIVLLGLNDDFPSDNSLVVEAESLRTTLDGLFSSYLPPMMPPASASRGDKAGASGQLNQHGSLISPFRVRYDISYHVSHASRAVHSEYLEVLANAAEVDTTGEDGDYHPLLVPIDAISQAAEKVASHESGMASSPIEDDFGDSVVTIFVANPSRAGLLAQLRSRGKLKPSAGVDSGQEGEYAFVEPGSLHRAAQRTEAKEGSSGTGDKDRGSCARSWVGQGRVLVLDLGAAACGYGALGEDDPRSTVTESMFPSGSLQGDSGYWLHSREQDRRGTLARDGITPDPATVFNMKLSSLVVSAIRTTLAPAIPAPPGPGDTSEVVMVPVLVFRGDVDGNGPEAKDPAQSEHPFSLDDVVDIAQVSKAVNSMALPQQEILVVGTVHSFSQHPQVAVALEKSLATNAKFHRRATSDHTHPDLEVRQEGFVNGDKLLMEMKSAGDVLASSLFSDLGGDGLLRLDVALGAGSRPKGSHELSGDSVRILPVFVFCLGDTDGPLSDFTSSSDLRDSTARVQERTPKRGVPARLFERSSPFKAEVGGDAVLVLQSEKSAPVPFYERQEMLRLPLTDATQAVVAGLLRSMHGSTAPDHWWPSEQQDAALDLTWAHGYHPFAPFGFGGSQPGELLAEVARRNAVVSRSAAVATTLAETAAVLEEFARAALPSELLMAGLWTRLCMDGAAIRGDWGQTFETAASSAGLSDTLAQPATNVHRLLHDALSDFERRLNTAKGGGLVKLVAAMDKQQTEAMSIYDEAMDVLKELEWCQCTTARVSSPSHLPWVLFSVAVLGIFFGVARLLAAARRALIGYVGNSGAGPTAR